ncbi:MAG: hypothetical protein JXQ83_07850 [Candidatus Glassbacteria bacterium]|nr:hypothetical protein [Candidatus Glassbacteria bacterium]
MFYLYKRKLILLALVLAVYTAVSFWIPYSKLNVLEYIMENQARLYFATQSIDRVRRILIEKAEALEIPVRNEDILVENINGEIIYLEMRWDEPVDILFYHTSLHFEPKIFGLIRGFDLDPNRQPTAAGPDVLAELSDSTARYLRNKDLQDYFKDFFNK